MKIIAYAYSAGHHCPQCANDAAACGVLLRQPPLSRETDEHGLALDLIDSEGNPVTPVFDTDETPREGICCDDCYEEIVEGADTPRRWLKEADSEGERDHAMALALYVYLSTHHRGQRSPEYELLCRLTAHFTPSPLQSLDEAEAFGDDWEADEVYGKFKRAEWCVREAIEALGM